MAASLPPADEATPGPVSPLRLTRAILVAAVLAVLAAGAMFAVHAEASRRAHARQASHMVAVLAALLAEQAGRLFDVADLLADRARGAAAEHDWADVAQQHDVQQEFAGLVREFKYVSGIWLIDQDGMPRLTSRAFPAPPVSVSDREFFQIHQRDRQAGTLISPVAQSRVVDERVLVLSQRIEDRSGDFRGVAVIALDPRHFLLLYDSIRVAYPVTVDLVRDDGAVLIRSAAREPFGPVAAPRQVAPPPPAERFSAGVAPAIEEATGIVTMQGLKRVRGFPAYAAVSVTEADIQARWLRELRFHALLAGLALLAILMALAAVRHFGRREARALAALGNENAVLEGRVRERSRAIERMIAEVKHRVKNSLQLAAGLLHLQRGRQADAAMRAPLGVAHARILAIARVHQQLHQAGGFDSIDLQSYLTTVARDAADTVSAPDRRVELSLDIEARSARLELAMPLGLILAEAIANAIRHTMPGRPVVVAIGLSVDGDGARLVVQDRGGGLPAGQIPGKSAGLGMQLLRGLSGQIGGELEVGNFGEGVRVVVKFAGLAPQPAEHRAVAAD
jgi:two-component sensor histidine kinase